MNKNDAYEIVKIALVIIGGPFAYYQYKKQQEFKRLQNLTAIWEKFIADEKLVELFNLFDSDQSQAIENFDRRVKIKFLGLLDEVALYVEHFEVDRKPAEYLFQWPFYYVFGNIKDEKSKNAFLN